MAKKGKKIRNYTPLPTANDHERTAAEQMEGAASSINNNERAAVDHERAANDHERTAVEPTEGGAK